MGDLWTDEDLQGVLSALKDCGAHPLFLTHYRDRQTELGRTLSCFLQEVAVRLSQLSVEERLALVSGLDPAWQREVSRDGLEQRSAEAVDMLAETLVMAALIEPYSDVRPYIREDGFASRSKVLRQHPELRERLDSDGLLRCGPGISLTQWCITYGDSAIHYTPLMRRGFSSNVNFDLSSGLVEFRRMASDASLAVAIDHDRLGHRDCVIPVEERAYWWGPKLDEPWLDDPQAVGLTVFGYERDDPATFPCRKMEVLRYLDHNDDALKVIQIEEVVDPARRSLLANFDGQDYVPNRYVHAIRDVRRGVMIHFDAAFRFYDRESYEERLAAELPKATPFRRIKIFRIDGQFSGQSWAVLTAAFFRDNHLILEVLGKEEQFAN